MFDASLSDADRLARALGAMAALAELRGRPADVLPRLLAELKDACGADGLAFERREGDELVHVATVGSFATLVGSRGGVTGSLGGSALLSRNVALAPDTMTDARVDRGLCLRSESAALVAIPVDVSGTPAGVLMAGWRTAHGYSDAAVNLLRIGAGIIAASVARTLLADRPEDPERLLASAFSQTSHREAGERRHGDLDVLTGLLKLEPFQTALSTSAAHWSPSQNSAVLFIDLDRFHRINEAHGHAVGDTVLQRVADVLRRCTRGHDIVARLGDDDFAVLLNRLSNPELQAAVAAERIIDAVLADNLTNESMPRIELCIGAALIDRAGLNAERVMRDAEHALHAEKTDRR
jgi:diguanylate cyclase (GGDEF)-like protein